MPKILSNIDMNKNEIQNVRIQNLATAPANPVSGQIYYNSADKKVYLYNGSTWIDLGQVFANKSILDAITASYTTAEKTKLAGIEAGANKYTHPSNHSASMITGLHACATTGDADTVDGKHASDFVKALANHVLNAGVHTKIDNTITFETLPNSIPEGFIITTPQDTQGKYISICEINSSTGDHVVTQYRLDDADEMLTIRRGVGTSWDSPYILATRKDLETHHARTNYTHGIGSGYYIAKTSRSDQLPAWGDIQGKPSNYEPSSHTHTKSQITDFPSSLPANGGNADTVDGKHASNFATSTHTHTKDDIQDLKDHLKDHLSHVEYVKIPSLDILPHQLPPGFSVTFGDFMSTNKYGMLLSFRTNEHLSDVPIAFQMFIPFSEEVSCFYFRSGAETMWKDFKLI